MNFFIKSKFQFFLNKTLADNFESSIFYKEVLDEVNLLSSDSLPEEYKSFKFKSISLYKATTLFQIFLLLWRNKIAIYRDKSSTAILIYQAFVNKSLIFIYRIIH